MIEFLTIAWLTIGSLVVASRIEELAVAAAMVLQGTGIEEKDIPIIFSVICVITTMLWPVLLMQEGE